MAAADDPPLLRALGGLSRSLVELGGDVGEGTREALAAAALGFTGKAPPALLGELLAAFRLPAEACPEEDVHLALTFVLAGKHLLKQKGALSPATPPALQGLLPLLQQPRSPPLLMDDPGARGRGGGGPPRAVGVVHVLPPPRPRRPRTPRPLPPGGGGHHFRSGGPGGLGIRRRRPPPRLPGGY